MDIQNPSIKEVQALIREDEVQYAFWVKHAKRFRKQYPDQYVAALDGKVVATAKHLDDLVTTLHGLGLDERGMWIWYAATEGFVL